MEDKQRYSSYTGTGFIMTFSVTQYPASWDEVVPEYLIIIPARKNNRNNTGELTPNNNNSTTTPTRQLKIHFTMSKVAYAYTDDKPGDDLPKGTYAEPSDGQMGLTEGP